MVTILSTLLAYLIGLAANLRTDAITEDRRKNLENALDKQAKDLFALKNYKSLRDQLRLLGTQIPQLMAQFDVQSEEQTLFELLADEVFQDELAQWLVMWDLEEAQQAKQKLQDHMLKALQHAGAPPKHIEWFRENYFTLIENLLFANPTLAHWRHHLGIITLKEQQDKMLEKIEQMVGQYSVKDRRKATDFYRDLALRTCDIIDLAGLPEDDRHIAVKNFVLRQLYIPLRVQLEAAGRADQTEEDLPELEKRRQIARYRDAGWTIPSDKEPRPVEKEPQRQPVGELLTSAKRLVVLGDPGSGKTTLTRWLTTAYLLRLKSDPELNKFPDIATLPAKGWLPVLIRCRELDHDAVAGPFDDILRQTIRMSEVPSQLVEPLRAAFREKLAEGSALLLVDGLDEITDPLLRCRFCRKLEQIATVFDKAPILITSRIVGYREMRFRMGHGFHHTTVTDLSKEDKDEFARRWCAVTEPEERQISSAEDLISNIHSSDRIERLTGNPMLLTTLALVKRKVGKLPNRRVDLYRETVQVLLNWRREIDEPLDWREAIPQLEYVAYTMCDRGTQQLRRDEIIKLLEEVREKYPNIRPIQKHTPEEFLSRLEQRTSILVEAGFTYENGQEVAVYEFRHLTFQEYLAALAIVNGRFPGHEKGTSLAQRIAPLAGKTRQHKQRIGRIGRKRGEAVVTENWREALRLCIAACNDDDVDDALVAILEPMNSEDPKQTTRPRTIMAALCLADEPNTNHDTAIRILKTLANQVSEQDGHGRFTSALDTTALELSRSEWDIPLQKALIEEFISRTGSSFEYLQHGSLYSMVSVAAAPSSKEEFKNWYARFILGIASDDELIAVGSALTIMFLAYEGKIPCLPYIVDSLLGMLNGSPSMACAASWALVWLSGAWGWDRGRRKRVIWKFQDNQVDTLIHAIQIHQQQKKIVEFCIILLGISENERAIATISENLQDENRSVRRAASSSLVNLYKIEKNQKRLLHSDPNIPITRKRVSEMAKKLKHTEEQVRQQYEELAPLFKLKLEWKQNS